MFKFLKDKVKSAISSISEKFEEEAEVVVEEKTEQKKKEVKVVVQEKKAAKEKKKEAPKEKKVDVPKEEKKVEIPQEEKKDDVKEVEEVVPKAGLLSRIKEKVTSKKISAVQFDQLFWDLEVGLLENNVAFEVIEKIKEDLKGKLVDQPLKRGQVETIIMSSLKGSVEELLDFSEFNLMDTIKAKKDGPYVIVFFGTNGAGKTTTIAKIANLLKNNDLSVTLGAGDSFRKGAVEQLELWGERLGMKVVSQGYDADPAAICFDTVAYARKQNVDVVLLDTAGRMHGNRNLMEELKKIERVAKPDLGILVAEALVGNDAVDQAKNFDKEVELDGIILTKADVDDKGGAIISMSYVVGKPIFFLGCGQNLEDLKPFNKAEILSQLNL